MSHEMEEQSARNRLARTLAAPAQCIKCNWIGPIGELVGHFRCPECRGDTRFVEHEKHSTVQ